MLCECHPRTKEAILLRLKFRPVLTEQVKQKTMSLTLLVLALPEGDPEARIRGQVAYLGGTDNNGRKMGKRN